MKMKRMLLSVSCFAVLLSLAPGLLAQDLSQYRSFSVGTNLATVLKLTDQKLTDVKMIYSRAALLQELTWWPPYFRGSHSQTDSVEQIHFSFYGGQLYKISVTYNRTAIEGFTIEDMVQSISANYGTPIKAASETTRLTSDRFDSRQKVIASWEDPLYTVNLVRLSYSDAFGVVIFSKSLAAKAESAIAEAVKLEEQERPQKEADQRKKESDDLEMARQRNRKMFRP
jgi:hypothetical protein